MEVAATEESTTLHDLLPDDKAAKADPCDAPPAFAPPKFPALPAGVPQQLAQKLEALRDGWSPLRHLSTPTPLPAEPNWAQLPSAAASALSAACGVDLQPAVAAELAALARGAVSRAIAVRAFAALATGRPRSIWAAALVPGALDDPPLPPRERLLALGGGAFDCGPLTALLEDGEGHFARWEGAGLGAQGPQLTRDAALLLRSAALLVSLRGAAVAGDWAGAARALAGCLGGGADGSGAGALHEPPPPCASFLAAALRASAAASVSAAAREELAALCLCVDRQRLRVDAEEAGRWWEEPEEDAAEGRGLERSEEEVGERGWAPAPPERVARALECARSVEKCALVLRGDGGCSSEGEAPPLAPSAFWGAPLRRWLASSAAGAALHALLPAAAATQLRVGAGGVVDAPPCEDAAAALRSFEGALCSAQEALSAAGGDCCTRVRPLWLLSTLRGAALVGGAGLRAGGALQYLPLGTSRAGSGSSVRALHTLLASAAAPGGAVAAVTADLARVEGGEGWAAGGESGDPQRVLLSELRRVPGAPREVAALFLAAAAATCAGALCGAVDACRGGGGGAGATAALVSTLALSLRVERELPRALAAEARAVAAPAPPPPLVALNRLASVLADARGGPRGAAAALLSAAREGTLTLSGGGVEVALPLPLACLLPAVAADALCSALGACAREEAEGAFAARVRAALGEGAPAGAAGALAWPPGSSPGAYAAALRRAVSGSAPAGGGALAAAAAAVAAAAEAVAEGAWDSPALLAPPAPPTEDARAPLSTLTSYGAHVWALAELAGAVEGGEGRARGAAGALVGVDAAPLVAAVRRVRARLEGVAPLSPAAALLAREALALAALRAAACGFGEVEVGPASEALLAARGALPPTLRDTCLPPGLFSAEVPLLASHFSATRADAALLDALSRGAGVGAAACGALALLPEAALGALRAGDAGEGEAGVAGGSQPPQWTAATAGLLRAAAAFTAAEAAMGEGRPDVAAHLLSRLRRAEGGVGPGLLCASVEVPPLPSTFACAPLGDAAPPPRAAHVCGAAPPPSAAVAAAWAAAVGAVPARADAPALPGCVAPPLSALLSRAAEAALDATLPLLCAAAARGELPVEAAVWASRVLGAAGGGDPPSRLCAGIAACGALQAAATAAFAGHWAPLLHACRLCGWWDSGGSEGVGGGGEGETLLSLSPPPAGAPPPPWHEPLAALHARALLALASSRLCGADGGCGGESGGGGDALVIAQAAARTLSRTDAAPPAAVAALRELISCVVDADGGCGARAAIAGAAPPVAHPLLHWRSPLVACAARLRCVRAAWAAEDGSASAALPPALRGRSARALATRASAAALLGPSPLLPGAPPPPPPLLLAALALLSDVAPPPPPPAPPVEHCAAHARVYAALAGAWGDWVAAALLDGVAGAWLSCAVGGEAAAAFEASGGGPPSPPLPPPPPSLAAALAAPPPPSAPPLLTALLAGLAAARASAEALCEERGDWAGAGARARALLHRSLVLRAPPAPPPAPPFPLLEQPLAPPALPLQLLPPLALAAAVAAPAAALRHLAAAASAGAVRVDARGDVLASELPPFLPLLADAIRAAESALDGAEAPLAREFCAAVHPQREEEAALSGLALAAAAGVVHVGALVARAAVGVARALAAFRGALAVARGGGGGATSARATLSALIEGLPAAPSSGGGGAACALGSPNAALEGLCAVARADAAAAGREVACAEAEQGALPVALRECAMLWAAPGEGSPQLPTAGAAGAALAALREAGRGYAAALRGYEPSAALVAMQASAAHVGALLEGALGACADGSGGACEQLLAAASRGHLLPALAAAEAAAATGVLCAAGSTTVRAARDAVEEVLFHRGLCSAIATTTTTRCGGGEAPLSLEALLGALRGTGVEPRSREGSAALATAFAALALRAAAGSGAPATMAAALDAVGAAASADALIVGALADDMRCVAAACDAARAVAAVEVALGGAAPASAGGDDARGNNLTQAWAVRGEPGALAFWEAGVGGEAGALSPHALARLPQALEAVVLDCGPPVAAALALGLPPPPGVERLLALSSAVAAMRAEALRCACSGGGGGGGALRACADAVSCALETLWPWRGDGARDPLRAALRSEAALCCAHGAGLAAEASLREALEGPTAARVGALRLSLPPSTGAFASACVGPNGLLELLLPDVPPGGAPLAELDAALRLADGAVALGGGGGGGALPALRAAAAALRDARAQLAGGRYADALESADGALRGEAHPPPRAAEELALIALLCRGVLGRAAAARRVAQLLRGPPREDSTELHAAVAGALELGCHVDPVWGRLLARALEALQGAGAPS
jgi:hypothetical protein